MMNTPEALPLPCFSFLLWDAGSMTEDWGRLRTGCQLPDQMPRGPGEEEQGEGGLRESRRGLLTLGWSLKPRTRASMGQEGGFCLTPLSLSWAF